ncbi:hypothetical protein HMPREF9444_00306, partial [Succinatimonas hippei YIT 12066]
KLFNNLTQAEEKNSISQRERFRTSDASPKSFRQEKSELIK